ncbi:MAG: hypothetical protein RDU14_15240 [Melioribacteraceae bacterium]|nr:hypothetical protein [Melioribacteraceae bacterium]
MGERSISFYTNDSNDSQLLINPRIGFFVINNLLLGLNITYLNIDSESQFYIGPIIRYYFGDNPNKFFTYLVLGLSVAGNTTSDVMGLGIGYNIALSRNVSVNPIIQFDTGVFSKRTPKELYVGIGMIAFIF